MSESEETLVGHKIGNYVIQSVLQEGGMGTVYVAEHPEIGRQVAIKVIAREHSQAPGIGDRFLAEAKAIARIDHPNIIDIYDFGRTAEGQLYYIMELLKGRELAMEMVRQGPMTAHQAVPYLNQICNALQAIHEKGVIHRDLKPENIYVLDRKPMTLKLIDFGIAKVVEPGRKASLTATGMVMGTPYTIAPEQAAGQPDKIGPQTDIYSLGVILYWMLAGHPPFTGEATAVILAKHIKEPPRPLREVDPSVPEDVAAVVERCLSKDVAKRPANATVVAAAFAAVVPEETPLLSGVDLDARVQQGAPLSRDLSSQTGDTLPRSPATPAQPAPQAFGANLARNDANRMLGADRNAVRLSSSAVRTTLRNAAGELLASSLARTDVHTWLKWAAFGSLTLAVLGLAALMTVRSAPTRRVVPKPSRIKVKAAKTPTSTALVSAAPESTADSSPKRAGDPAGNARAPGAAHRVAWVDESTTEDLMDDDENNRMRRILVRSDDPQAECHARVNGVDLGSQMVPCHLQVTAGQHVHLTVTRPGFVPFTREWSVSDSAILTLQAKLPDRRMLLVADSSRKQASTKQHGTSRTAATRAHRTRRHNPPSHNDGPVRTRHKDRRSASKQTPPAENSSKERSPLGEGTMEF